MDMKNFFYLGSRLVSSTFQAYPCGLKNDKNGMSEHYQLIKGKYDGIDFPVVFKQDYGKKLTDILDTGLAGLYLISDYLKTILKDNNFTGWRVYPIKLYDKKGNEINGYHGFSVIGTCGPLSYAESEIIEKRYVPEGPIVRFYKGVKIDTWDGNDFFTSEGYYRTIVTKKVADVLKKHKISNMQLSNLAEKEVSVRSVTGHD